MSGLSRRRRSERAHNSPLGIITKKLSSPTARIYPVDSTLIYNILLNNGSPPDRHHRSEEQRSVQRPRRLHSSLPPDGVGYAAGGGGADDNGLNYQIENRWLGNANLDFQADRYNRLKFGGQLHQLRHHQLPRRRHWPRTSTPASRWPTTPTPKTASTSATWCSSAALRYDYYWSQGVALQRIPGNLRAARFRPIRAARPER